RASSPRAGRRSNPICDSRRSRRSPRSADRERPLPGLPRSHGPALPGGRRRAGRGGQGGRAPGRERAGHGGEPHRDRAARGLGRGGTDHARGPSLPRRRPGGAPARVHRHRRLGSDCGGERGRPRPRRLGERGRRPRALRLHPARGGPPRTPGGGGLHGRREPRGRARHPRGAGGLSHRRTCDARGARRRGTCQPPAERNVRAGGALARRPRRAPAPAGGAAALPRGPRPAPPEPRVGMTEPGRVYLVGAGPGDPGLMTVRGIEVLRRARVVVYDRLVNPALLDEAPPRALRVFAGKHAGAHCLPQARINALLVEHARAGGFVVRLKGGDPFEFGPGVSAAVAVPAYAGIPVTHRGLGSSFAVVTGHEDPDKGAESVDWARLATAVDTLVVLMGLRSLPRIAATLMAHGRVPETPVALIRWGTTEAQETVTGTLGDIVVRAQHAGLAPPVLAVIGPVVGLRDRLDWFGARGGLREAVLAGAP